MGRKVWEVKPIDREKAKKLAGELDIAPFAALILISRGFDTAEKISEFLSEEDLFCDPYDLIDMDKAVDRINRALETEEKICIYGDYDCDGVTSTSLLFSYLSMSGANVTYYIPDRATEGYGLNNNAIKSIADDGVNLIVTVDNGVSAIKEAEYIKELGMELVVTDHHRVGDLLPECCAVVDPHRKDCPSVFKEWCGVGIVFKLLTALSFGDYESILDDYADIIALGTIGDVVSLTGENRLLVKYGLKKLNSNNCNYGLSSLIDIAGVKKPIASTSVAFYLSPRINAVGRISTANNAFELLVCEDETKAEILAKNISDYNVERQAYEQSILEEIENAISLDSAFLNDRVLVFSGKNWHGGVIGIVAARLVERFGKPCLVITTDGVNAKGSARSIEGFNLFDCITSCNHLLTHYGGHPLAAGFSLVDEKIEEFRKAVNDYAKMVDMPFQKLVIDCKLKVGAISADLLPIIDELEPFGQDNESPVFGIFGVILQSVFPMGKGKHLKLNVTKGDSTISIMKFRTTVDEFPYVAGDVLDFAVTLSKNEYKEQVSVSVIAKDVRMSGTDDSLYLKSIRLYDKFKRGDELNEKETKFITPERDDITKIYKLIKQYKEWNYDYDILCYRLNDDGRYACRFAVAIDVLVELGVLVRTIKGITLPETLIKVNLENSEILKKLKS